MIKILNIQLNFKHRKIYLDEQQGYAKQYFVPKYVTATWSESRGICQQYGLDIASFEVQDESNRILDLLQSHKSAQSQPEAFWVGGVATIPKSRNGWFWSSSGKSINYMLKWSPNEPNNAGGNENCLAIWNPNGQWEYNDANCDSSGPAVLFICQIRGYPKGS